MNELTTSIVGIDFPNEDKSNSNRRMEWMLCAPGDLVELRLEPTNPFDDNAVAIFSDRGTQLGCVSAERAPLIGKRMKEDDATAVFQAMHGNGAYIRIRFGGGLPTVVEGFHEMIRRKTEADLVPWIERGRGSLVASFANGIARDVAAVRAAFVAPQARDSGQYRGKRHIRGGRTVLRQALHAGPRCYEVQRRSESQISGAGNRREAAQGRYHRLCASSSSSQIRCSRPTGNGSIRPRDHGGYSSLFT